MSKIDFQKELNSEQYRAVTAPDGPHLILAGAGSGKTRTLVYRVAYLIEQGVKPEKILLLTFTNKAANEMMSRVAELLHWQDKNKLPIWGGTFHSIANRLLRFYGAKIGIQNNFNILDEDDAKSLLKNIISEFFGHLAANRRPNASLAKELISFSINSRISLAEALEIKFSEWQNFLELFEKVAAEYQKRKKLSNVLDFDDLLLYWKILTEDSEMQKIFDQKWQYVLVDEYQDTNTLQAEIIFNLSKNHQNILVVGDDAQSIYSFRAANIQNILDFPKVFPRATVYKLETNYRSTPEILALANEIIALNTNQFAKNLQAILTSYVKPELIALENNLREAKWIADRIEALIAEGVPAIEIVVLFRASHHSQSLEMELNRRGIAYQMRGGLRFFDRAHIKDILAWLKVLTNTKDEVAWARILNLYPGIGPATAQKIYAQVSGLESLENIDQVAFNLGSKAQTSWQQISQVMTSLFRQQKANPAELIRMLIKEYQEYLTAQYPDYRQRSEDLEQLAIFSSSYQDLNAFLSEITLQEKFNADDGHDQEAIILSTIHQAKGLEWQAVFLMNLTNKSLPHPLAVSETEQEEERRLFYVAVTRAKKHLYLTYPMSQFSYDGYKSLTASPFVSQLATTFLNYNHLARSTMTTESDDTEYSFEDTAGDFWEEDTKHPRQKIKPGDFLPDIEDW
ncbi:ATP-dependent helicase [Candidatus Nomurabacteria bacterium]|nr:ATP-dependent helicase [Candidatus Nomurabacteria bacterium]